MKNTTLNQNIPCSTNLMTMYAWNVDSYMYVEVDPENNDARDMALAYDFHNLTALSFKNKYLFAEKST